MVEQYRRWRLQRYISRLKGKGLRIGENVFLNDGFFLDPSHCDLISIGDNVVFGPGVAVLAHDAALKKVVGKTRVKPVILKQNCFIGARSIILPGACVGENSIIGAGSVVTGSVPDREVWAGVPAKKLMTVDELRNGLAQPNLPAISVNDYLHSDSLRESFSEQVKQVGSGWIG